MSEDLAQKTCTPCQGGIPPMSETQAKAFLDEAPGWRLEENGTWLKRDFTFKTFKEALAFINKVGELAEAEGHHPDLTLGYGYAGVAMQTHKIKGLHENDFIMAAKIGRIAEQG